MKHKILLTGATSGFGAGTALGLAKAGHHVMAGGETWQQVTALRERAEQEKVKLTVIKLDLLDALDIDHAAQLEIDTLVLNAGVQESGALVDIPLERVRHSFEVNVFGHLALAQRLIPGMMKHKSGKIIWVSSQAGLMEVHIPMPNPAPLMKLQHDPQPMIDAMVEMIQDRKAAYRTMLPEDAVAEAKLSQQLGWTQKAR
jgi:short-subunit dehydrogenase